MDADLPIMTTSSRRKLKQCPQAWWWQYVDGYDSVDEAPDALWFGIGVHEALAQWYKDGRKRGVHPAKFFQKWVGDEIREIRAAYADHEMDFDDLPLYEDAGELGVAMLTGYVDKYGRDKNWDVLAIEQPFSIKVKLGNKIMGVFKSTFDGVYRDDDDGLIYLMEHKTAAQIALAYLQLDDQGGSYWAVATRILRAKGIIGPNEAIAGVTYNFLRKAMPDERPQDELGRYLNKDGSVSKNQGTPRFVREPVTRQPREQAQQIRKIGEEFKLMQAYLSGTLPVTKSPDKDCVRCPFFLGCQLHDRGGNDWKRFFASEFDVADPFERYRLAKSAS